MNQSCPDDLQVLLRTDSAFQAYAIVAALKDNGIDAIAMEETLMDALNPREAKTMVLVAEHDLTRAQFSVDNARSTARELDWTEIDVGDHSELTPEERDGGSFTRSSVRRRSVPPLILGLAILGGLLIVIGLIAFVITLFLPNS